MKQVILKGKVDVTVYIWIPDSSSTTGAGLTGLVFNSSGLVCYYVRPLGSATQLTLATQTVTGAHSDGGFVEVSSTNMPGLYRLDLSDAICAAGVDSVVVELKGATNMAPVVLEIQLSAFDLQDADPGVDVVKWLGTAPLTPNTAGVPRVDLDLIEGSNVSTSTAQLGVNMVSGAAGAITASVIATDAIDADAIAAGAIDAAAIADGAIDRAAFAADTGLQTTRSGTAQAGAAGSITLDASASATDDIYNDQWVYITGATGAGQARRISDYVGSTKVASVEPNWQVNPDSSSTFAILPSGRVDVGAWLGAIVNALISGRVDANAQVVGDKTGYSIGTGGIVAGSFAAGAIDAAAIATGAIDADALAADAITAAKVASGTIDAATFAAGAIDAASIATGAITAAKFAAGAVDAAALAADAANEIRDAVWAKAMTELGAVPGVTASVIDALEWLFLLARNKRTCTSTTETLRNDADSSSIATASVSDDGTTATRNEWA